MSKGTETMKIHHRTVLVLGLLALLLAPSTLFAEPRTFRPTASLGTARFDHTATLLPPPDGRVLVVGGTNGTSLASAEIYDPVTATWSPTGSLATPRAGHRATLLPDGKVLVTGGANGTT